MEPFLLDKESNLPKWFFVLEIKLIHRHSFYKLRCESAQIFVYLPEKGFVWAILKVEGIELCFDEVESEVVVFPENKK